MSRIAAQIVFISGGTQHDRVCGHGESGFLAIGPEGEDYSNGGWGLLNQDIAVRLGTTRPTVQLWRDRFLALRLAGLEKDAPRPVVCQDSGREDC